MAESWDSHLPTSGSSRYGSVDPKPSFAFPDEELEERAHRAAASRAPARSPFQYYQQQASDKATSHADEGQQADGEEEDEHDTLLGPAYGPRPGYEPLGNVRRVSPARVAACGLMVGLLVVVGALLHLERLDSAMQRGQSSPPSLPTAGLRMFEKTEKPGPSSPVPVGEDSATPSPPQASSSVSVEFEVENTYGTHTYMKSHYTWLDGYKLVEPYRNTTFRITSVEEGYVYTWLVYDSSNTLTSQPFYGSEISLTLTATGRYAVVLTASEEVGGDTVAHSRETVFCKYVRREMRTLTTGDREAFFDAAHTVWGVPTPLGQEKYGSDFLDMKYFVVYHLSHSAKATCDQLHDGLGFFTQHMALTMRFEKAVQAVAPHVTVPYWDFTIDAEEIFLNKDKDLSDYWLKGSVFTDAMMGRTDPDLHTVTSGRWAFTKVDKNTDPDGVHNAYGLLRSPWNTNKDPYVTRYPTFCGHDYSDSYLPFPTCAIHYNAIAGYNTFESFMWSVPYTPHGPIHQIMGGTFGCEDSISKMYDLGLDPDFVGWTAQHTFLSHKNLWKAELLTCPSDCSEDTPQEECMCTCPQFEGDAASGNYSLYIQKAVPIGSYAELLSSYPTSVQVEYLRLMCNSGVMAGDQVEAASPNDISFWPIHPTLERLWMYKKMMNLFTDETWPDTGVSSYGDDCTGHRSTDVIELGDFLKIGKDGITNGEYYAYMDPSTDLLDYVYDDFSWSHCLELQDIDFSSMREGIELPTLTGTSRR